MEVDTKSKVCAPPDPPESVSSLSAAHRCLFVAEILSIIARFTNNFPTLSALLRTCRAFHEPTLNELWHTQDSIMPLIKCMPSDLWRVTDDKNLDFVRPIFPSDWLRWWHYAGRIRSMKIGKEISADAFRTLSIYRSKLDLLPGLQTLKWAVEDNNLFPFIHIFLSANVKSIHLDFQYQNASSSVCVQFVNYLTVSCPSLESLELYADDEFTTDNIPPTLMTSPLQLQCLKFFVWQAPIKMEDVTVLSALPNLNRLDINIADSMFQQLPTASFPALHFLDLSAITLKHCTAFIEKFSMCCLRHVDLSCDEVVEPAVFSEMIRAIHKSCNHQSLTELTIMDSIRGLEGYPLRANLGHGINALEPLLVFKKLKKVTFDLDYPFEFSDSSLKRIAAAWPRISTLAFRAPLSKRNSGLTLWGIGTLVFHCQKLRNLHIAVDARLDPDINVPAFSCTNDHIDHINLGDSSISNPIPVAMFLSSLFPKLRHIQTTQSDMIMKEHWSLVEGLVKAFRSVRADERKRLLNSKDMPAARAGENMISGGLSSSLDRTVDN